jgi:hypothetical protein
MERAKYLELCKSTAMLPSEACGTKRNVPDRLKVMCSSIPYYPIAYELRYARDGTVQHIAILHDLQANSITKCKLNDVEGLIE